MPDHVNTHNEGEQKGFNVADLSDDDKKHFDFFNKRIVQLQVARRNHFGRNLDRLWAEADRDYVPHRMNTKGRRAVATDEDKGWRGALITLGASDWQSDVSQSNVYTKIQTALSILVDQNPGGVFTATAKKYEATTELMKQLYRRSWEFADSKEQLKLFVFNLAKYGWAIGRTYPLKITNNVRELVKIDQDNPDNNEYEEKEVIEFNDIMRENLDPRNTWIDDMARPHDKRSIRDWAWRKVYDMDVAEQEFGAYKNWEFVMPGGNTLETVRETAVKGEKRPDPENMVEILFYENRMKDLFMVVANGVPVVMEPLPVSDSNGNKKLSMWQTFWTLRHAESIFGIGVYEAVRYNQALLDRIRNMSIDQLTLSIYKMFFYTGTQALTDTGDIVIAPGVGRQVLDPKNINWLDVPGPGKDAWDGIERFQKDVDKDSGITETLEGTITGKTAFEIAQAKEAALKRLKNPLDNILSALNEEGYLTVSLIQLLYSIPEVHKITDTGLIDAYLQEIKGDEELYSRDEDGNFIANIFPEFPLNLEDDGEGNLIETDDTKFFRVKPRFLKWEGMINIEAQSLLTPSKQVDKSLTLEMYNILIPMLANPPELYRKIAKDIVKLYEKDPREILPESWLTNQQQPLMVDQAQLIPEQGAAPRTQRGAPQAPKIVPSTQAPQQPQSLVGKIASRITQPFRL